MYSHLENNDSPFLELFDRSSDLIALLDKEGKYQHVNAAFEDILGYSPNELTQKSYTELVKNEFLNDSNSAFKEILSGKVIRSFDTIMVSKSGKNVPVNWSAYWSEFEQRVFAIGRETIKEKKSSRSLNQSTLKYKSLFEQSSDSIMITDFHGNFIDVNSSLCRIFGYEKEDLLGMNVNQLLDKEELKTRPIAFDKIRSGEHIFNQRRMLRRDGAIILVEANVRKMDESCIVAIAKDITAIKTAETEIQEKEELLKLFVKHSPAALAMFDTNMQYMITSDRWLSDYNLGNTDITGRSHYDVFKDIPDRWKEIHQHCLKGNIARNDEDYFIDNSGMQLWNKWEILPWYRTNGEVGGIIMLTEVITKFKEAEKKFSDLAKNPLVGVFIVQDKQVVYANQALAKTFGFTCVEQTLHIPIEKLVSDSDLSQFGNMLDLNEAENLHFEFKGLHTEGHEVWIELFANRSVYNGKPAVIGTMIDITQRKKTEEENKLVNSKKKKRIKELTTIYRVGQILQNKDDSIENQLEKIVRLVPQGWQHTEIAAARIVFSGSVYLSAQYKPSAQSIIKTFETSDGKLGILEVVYTEAKPILDEGPFLKEERTLLNMIAEMLQIYINRTIEAEALLKSETNLKTIFQNTDSIYVLTDHNMKIVSYNQAALAFVKNELGIEDPDKFELKEYFRQDRSSTIQHALEEIHKGKDVHYEADYRKDDGSGRWYDVRINPVMNEHVFMGVMLSLNDITDRKTREESHTNQIRLFKELSFIISHELRHEYIKLHEVVNLLSQTDHVDAELKRILDESKNTFSNLNESIFKLNDKISDFSDTI